MDIDTEGDIAQMSDRLTRQEVNFITLTENPYDDVNFKVEFKQRAIPT